MNYFNYSRRQANEVYVGATPMGGAYPIRIQSMTNTVTMDTEACVEQAKRIIEAGENTYVSPHKEYVKQRTCSISMHLCVPRDTRLL